MKQNFLLKLVFAILLSGYFSVSYAADWYISATGDDTTGNGLTPATAWASFSKAQTAATAGDVIHVSGMIDMWSDPANTTYTTLASGTSTTNKTGIEITKSLTIQGTSPFTDGFNGTNTTNNTRLFRILSNITVIIKDLNMANAVINSNTGAGGEFGGAIRITNGNIIAENVIFESNIATGHNNSSGAALFIEGTNTTGTSFKNCVFTNNAASRAGAIYINNWGGVLSFESCSFLGNESKITNGGSAIFIRSATDNTTCNIINSTFRGNKVLATGNGGTIYLGAKAMASTNINIINCTITENTTAGNAGNCAGVHILNTTANCIGNLYIKNSIIEGNTAAGGSYADLSVAAISPTSPNGGSSTVPGYIKIENSIIGRCGTDVARIPAANRPDPNEFNHLPTSPAPSSADFKAKFGTFNSSKNYYPLLSNSYAINYGNSELLAPFSTTDQLGNTRPFTNDKCHAGAVEVKAILSATNADVSGLGANNLTDLIVTANLLTINQPTAVNSITVSPGAKVSISGTNALTASNGIVLESNADATATLVDGYETPTVNATVKQYVTAGRNWYMSAPLNSAGVSALNRGASVQYYNEVSGEWQMASGTLARGRGYIQVANATQGSTGTVEFTGTTNSGDVEIALTYTSDKGKGFNLVGNPYPSHLNWQAVADGNVDANMPTGTMWYRTINYNGKSAWAPSTAYNQDDVVYNGTRFYKVTTAGTSAASGGPTGTTTSNDGSVVWAYQGSAYIFATVNADGEATPSTVSNLIPPMQAFWVKSTGGTLTFRNTMRSHGSGSNVLKAPQASDKKLIRLRVSNGASADESVIYTSTNAQNSFDSYDAPKYFNASSGQPEIFTLVGSEKLAINAMDEMGIGTEIQLGFLTDKANLFSISASEIKNFDKGVHLILQDKYQKTEFDLTNGESYNFSSDVAHSTDRFILLFRAPGATTGMDNADTASTKIFVNAANQITIMAPEKSAYSIYNAVGMLMEHGIVESGFETRNPKLIPGVYVVKVNNSSTRVIIK
jgi:hypothetical protein